MSFPRVSVVIPAFNAQRFLPQAIDSILAQSFRDFELIVIDDGSVDSTAEVLASYAHEPRLRVVTHRYNRGLPYTRNEGLDLARGEFIALLDSDDVCATQRFARQIHYLDAHPDIAVLGSWVNKIDTHGNKLSPTSGKRPVHPDALTAVMLFHCGLYNPSVMARAEILRSYRYRDTFRVGQDYDLWVRLAKHHRLANLPERLTDYRAHSRQITAENIALVNTKTHLIHAEQLHDLGLDFNRADLDNHYLIKYGGKAFQRVAGRPLDVAYLRWANRWLINIIRANERTRRLPEPELSHITGHLWTDLCRKTARYAGRGIWWEFWKSPLRSLAVAARGKAKIL